PVQTKAENALAISSGSGRSPVPGPCNSEALRTIIGGQKLRWDGRLVAVAQGRVHRRHDLDARGIEAILNVAVQVGIGDEHAMRIPRVGVDFILNVGMLQLPLQYKRRWVRQDVLRLAGGFEQ